MDQPDPSDVVVAAAALAPLSRIDDEDPIWSSIAVPTAWTAARAVEHLSDALLFYARQVARRAERSLPVIRNGRSAPPSEQLDNAVSSAYVFAGLLRDLGSDRAWHPSGNADVGGWTGMAVTELLVHGHDVAGVLHVELQLPTKVCNRTLKRVLPWVPLGLAEPDQLLLAVTGRLRIEGVPNDPLWWWQSEPLSEWDGRPRQRTSPPGWR